MERNIKISRTAGLLLVLLLFLTSGDLWSKAQESAVPSPDVIDQITHDKGNIVTTVDNWGYIGGYYYYDYPSGEWPKNSGHNYIGEMMFWMGATMPSGDTVVANSDDDFRPLPSLISDTTAYGIHLSTDTTRFNYDMTDTVGAGHGNPAYGWRVYDADSGAWVYNQLYSVGDSAYYSGGPTGLQQSFVRYEDGNAPTALGLEISQTICQWNYCYNEDIMFVILEITNASTNDYSDFAFGIYCDFDIGGPDGTGENGRLGDLVDFDSTENLAWTYDADGYDKGWGGSVTTGIMGTKYLETPDNIGMTAFRTGQWEDLPDNDPDRYSVLNSEQYDVTLSERDQYYLQCTRGINLTAGKTVRVVYAIIAGADLEEFNENAQMAQTLYDNNYVGPQPPKEPSLTVRAGHKKVYLSWSDTSEVDVDPLSGVADFKGYKLYRSTNLGYTWGKKNYKTSNTCLEFDYTPVATFKVESAGDPIQHSFTDTNLTNGVEYWYCLVAFDNGDSTIPIDALQNGFGSPGSDVNAVTVTPRSDPAGHYDALATVNHLVLNSSTPSEGEVYPIIFDDAELMDDEYYIVFTETDYVTYWNLIRVDEAADDTTWVLQNQTLVTGDPGMYEIAEGIRAVVRNEGERMPASIVQTGFATAGDTTLSLGYNYGPMGDAFGYPLGSDKHFRSNYELRFTATGSEGYWFWDDVTPVSLPFEVWNTTLNYQVVAEIYDQDFDQVWEPEDRDYIIIVDIPYDGNSHPEGFPYHHSWFFRVGDADTSYQNGDILTVAGAPVNGADDVFSFKVDGVSSSTAAAELKDIRVVPDPYIGRSSKNGLNFEPNKYLHELEFTNLPDKCTLRIYTLGGDLVRSIDHYAGGPYSQGGTVKWDMLTEDGLGIVSGIYFYHVESQYGNRVGRFAVIK